MNRRLLLFAFAASLTFAESYDPKLFAGMRWRSIGPFRGGRTRACAGVPGQPNVFYIGAVNGGVWKTTDYGRTWRPIFEDQLTGWIGTIAVAPSDGTSEPCGAGVLASFLESIEARENHQHGFAVGTPIAQLWRGEHRQWHLRNKKRTAPTIR